MALQRRNRWFGAWTVIVVATVTDGPAAQQAANPGLEQRVAQSRGAERMDLLLELAESLPEASKRVVELTTEALELEARYPSSRCELAARLQRSWAHQRLANYEAALADAERAEAISSASTERRSVARATYLVAVAKYRMARFPEALTDAMRAREMQSDAELRDALGATLTLIGAIERARGNYETAIEAHLAALEIGEAMADERAIARSRNNIGLIYWRLDRLDEAHAEIVGALEITRRLGSERAVATGASNAGLILIEMKQPDAAMTYLEESLAAHERLDNPLGKAKALSNLAYACEELGDLDAALDKYREALTLRRRIGDRHGAVRTMGSISVIYQNRGSHGPALLLLGKAMEMAESIGMRPEHAELLKAASESHAALGDHEQALSLYTRHHDLKMQVSGADTQRRVLALEEKRATAVQERQIRDLGDVAEARQRVIEEGESWAQTLLLGSSLLGVGLASVVLLYRSRGKALRETRASHERLHTATVRLGESEHKYRTLFENSTIPTLLVDNNRRRVVDLNRPARDLCSDLPTGGLPVDALEPFWVRDAVGRLLDAQDGAEESGLEDCWIECSGRMRWTEIRSTQVSVEGSSSRLITVRDTTEEHTEEEARLRADKMASLGVLAGGIAHDFNNALSAILGNVNLARGASRKDAEEALQRAETATMDAARFTSRLLTFAKGGKPVREIHDTAALIREAVEMANAGSEMRVDLDLSHDLAHSRLDKNLFQQAVSNLVINAAQASGAGGRLTVRGRNVPGDQHQIQIQFEDNGPGVPLELRDQVFDPYFTTRSNAPGLGLTTAFAIVTNHDGRLTLEPTQGPGATFSMVLPATEPTKVAVQPRPETDASPTPGSVLVLDDEAMLRRVYTGMLEQWGYQVESVADGDSAIERYRERRAAGSPFDLMIMDLTIPGGMGGREALARILEEDPAAIAIVASGYSNDPVMANYRDAGFVGAVPKPFRAADLAKAVGEALRARPQRPD